MPFKLKIPFYTISLQLKEGITIRYPITDRNAFHISQSPSAVARRFSELYQSKMLDEGDFYNILDEFRDGDFYKNTTTVHFPASRDGIRHPELELDFDYYFNITPNGFWGIIPALGLEAFGKDDQDLEDGLREIVRLEFLKNHRLNTVQDILETIWYKRVDLTRSEIQLKVPTPGELDQKGADQEEGLLHRAAQPLKISTQQLFGYEKEMNQLLRDVKNKYSRNVLIVGPSGVGKTTMVWELARVGKKFKIPGKIWETTASLLIKELVFGNGWKPNLVTLAKELSNQNDFLYVRNLMELFEVGMSVGNKVSMAQYMQTFLAKGEINLISECTDEELARIELEYPGFLSLFHLIRLQPPADNTLEEVIQKKVLSIANTKKVNITIEAIQEMIRLTNRFLPYEGMPGSPIRFLERLVMHRSAKYSGEKEVRPSEVLEHFCKETGLPVFIVDSEIPIDLRDVRQQFEKNIFGQPLAIDAVVDTLASVKMALTKKDKPIASLLFTGPTGVGKTELAKTLAEFMFGDRSRMVRFDMSEYSDPYAVVRLSGYSGQEGLLSNVIRKEPFCVLLFDEVEKADSGFFDILLQILGEGRFTDGTGKPVNFCSTIILMTSNIGVELLQRPTVNLTKKNKEQENQYLADQLDGEIQKFFRPELYNRIDKVVIFNALEKNGIRFIVDREISFFLNREGIKYRKINIEIQPEIYNYLGEKGYNHQYGARYLQRTIREELIIPVSRVVNRFEVDEQLVVKILLENSTIIVKAEEDPLGFELLLEELEISNWANHAANLRRSIRNLQEGHLFTRLQSELEMMNAQLENKEEKNKLWSDATKAKRYTDFIDKKQKHEALTREIEKHEESLCLAYLNLENYNAEVCQQVEQWSMDFFNFKLGLLSVLRPQLNTAYFSIYGRQAAEITDYYLELFAKLGFTVKANAVWFRENYYNQEVLVDVETEEGHTIKRKGIREEYIKTPVEYDGQQKSYKPEQKNDVLYGFEFIVTGTCAFLALKSEAGVQKWTLTENEETNFLFTVNDILTATPRQIHRTEIYKRQKLLRRVSAINRSNPTVTLKPKSTKTDLIPWLEEHLTEQLIIEVEQAVK